MASGYPFWPTRTRDDPGKLNRACWAAKLGGCSSKLSKEHVVSRSISNALRLDLGITLHNQTKRIGAKSLTLSILCDRHNSLLSELDSEAGKLVSTVDKFIKNFPELLDNSTESVEQCIQIDGSKLERWAIKTFLNHSVLLGCFPNDVPSGSVSGDKIVEYVFSKSSRPENCGLYLYNVTPMMPILKYENVFKLQTRSVKSRIWRKATGKWDDTELRVPIYMMMTLYGYKFAISANIAGLSDKNWKEMISNITDYPGKTATLHPARLGFSFRGSLLPEKCVTLWVDVVWDTNKPSDRGEFVMVEI